MKVLVCLLVTVLCGGCTSVESALNKLPQVSANEIRLSQSNLWTSMQVDATNLRQTPTQATADSLSVQISVPFLGTTAVSIKDYVRDKRVEVMPDDGVVE